MTEDDWRLTAHARQRASERGCTVSQVLAAAATPEQVLPHKDDPRKRVHVRQGCQIVVDPGVGEVLTVLTRLPSAVPPVMFQPPEPPKREYIVSAEAVSQLSGRIGGKIAESKLPPAPKHCTFTWVEDELPEAARGQAGLQKEWLAEILPRLEQRPGVWAEVMTYDAPGSASTKLKALREEHPRFEWTSRKRGQAKQDGSWSKVFARFPGTAEAAAE